MLDILLDAFLDTIKLIPFLFITYLIMEYIENKTSGKIKEKIEKSGKFGPLIGGILGIVPQCGFSASATNLYASRIISMGTLIAVYLSTSDEMIPIFISEAMPISLMFKILAIFRKIKKNKEKEEITDICEHEHCHCHENGIIKASLIHTLNITIYIFIITLVINSIIGIVGEETIEIFIKNNVFLGPIIASLIGLIPNCAASVIITNLYIQNVINMASLIAGLLTGAGVGLIVLFRTNKKHLKENLLIMALLYIIGVGSGLVLQVIL